MSTDTAYAAETGALAREHRRLGVAPWAAALAVALPLAIAWLIVSPPAADLAAATYRSDLFARAGFTLWDTGWYGGHHMPAYSLLSPALGALLGVRLLAALSVAAAAALFGALAGEWLPRSAARAAAVVFAVGLSVSLLSGRVPFDLGLALALAALLALARGPLALAIGLGAVAAVASPVDGAFLALVALAIAAGAAAGGGASRRDLAGPLALVATGLVPVAALAAAFPEGGFEPYAASSFWPQLAGTIAVGAAVALAGRLGPRARAAVIAGAALYAVALIGSYVIRTPMGSNSARLGELLAAPLAAGALWGGRRALLVAMAPALLYWQLSTPPFDLASIAGDPAVSASYYQPLRGELERLTGRQPVRVEVPLTRGHYEAAYLAGGNIMLARGWERQLDERYNALFYGARLTAPAYRAWLAENGVAYVALPDARIDFAAGTEAALIERGLPFLAPVWRSAHWRLYAVRGAAPLARRPARLEAIGGDWFSLQAPHAGAWPVRLRFTRYWTVLSGEACVSEEGGWTVVQARAPGLVRVAARLSLAGLLGRSRCR